jgi:hypothetical protein
MNCPQEIAFSKLSPFVSDVPFVCPLRRKTARFCFGCALLSVNLLRLSLTRPLFDLFARLIREIECSNEETSQFCDFR